MTEKEALIKWLEIREENGIPFPTSVLTLRVALEHSSLYPRLISSSRIYPFRPPLAYSYPNYLLLDNKQYTPREIWFPGSIGLEGLVASSVYPNALVVIVDQFAWRVTDVVEPNKQYLITYDKHEFEDVGFKLTKVKDHTWSLEMVNTL